MVSMYRLYAISRVASVSMPFGGGVSLGDADRVEGYNSGWTEGGNRRVVLRHESKQEGREKEKK